MNACEQPKFYRGRPIIQPGETYRIDGVLHKVITATSRIIGVNGDGIGLSKPVYWLDNLDTNERLYIGEKDLQSKFKE